MEARQKREGFAAFRASLSKQSSAQLVQLIGELYQLSRENQRFLLARLGEPATQLGVYRQLVTDAMFPDPLRKGAEVRIADAKRAISQYERATRDGAGTLELMLTFVEQGTAFGADVGYGDDGFFSSLERMLSRTLERFRKSASEIQQAIKPRLLDLPRAARDIGWGYGDFVADAVAQAVPEAN